MTEKLPDWPLMDAALEIVETDDGALVEAKASGRVHYVNGSAAYILSCCDGKTNIVAIAGQVQAEFALLDTPLELVKDILRQFVAEGVVSAGPAPRE